MKKEKEHSKFIIQRFDQYIAAANIKGNFLLAFNTFLCGIVVANYNELLKLVSSDVDYILNGLIITLILCALISTGYIVAAVYPFFRSGKSSKEKYHSLIFFKTISEYTDDQEFMERFQEQKDEDVHSDLARQAYWLSKGLADKYDRLAIAMGGVFVQLLIILILTILISSY